MNRKSRYFFVVAILILLMQACNMPRASVPTETALPLTDTPLPASEAPLPLTDTPLPASEAPPTETPGFQHQNIPVSAPDTRPYPDVVSVDTAPEKRAPYGDSYDINRLERPFTQDMTYIPDMDISSFSASEDSNWIFVSIALVGKNPNNPAGIHYAVELDNNLDSFGDFLILAQPPYSQEWTASNVKIYADTNRDSAGRNPSKSDAPFSGDGYDKLIHSLADGIGDDIDLAWVRINAGQYATVQFAFKKTLVNGSFFYSVLADAGLKDVRRLDYVDYFTETEAGSSVRRNPNYPLKALYAVDNTCFQAFGFKPTGYEPKVCPEIVQPFVEQPDKPPPPVDYCTSIGRPDPGNCPYGWAGEPFCVCIPG